MQYAKALKPILPCHILPIRSLAYSLVGFFFRVVPKRVLVMGLGGSSNRTFRIQNVTRSRDMRLRGQRFHSLIYFQLLAPICNRYRKSRTGCFALRWVCMQSRLRTTYHRIPVPNRMIAMCPTPSTLRYAHNLLHNNIRYYTIHPRAGHNIKKTTLLAIHWAGHIATK